MLVFLKVQNKKKPPKGGFLVTLQGLEPQLTGPKPVVLPLHHRVMSTLSRTFGSVMEARTCQF